MAHTRWQGSACIGLSVQLPPRTADRVRYPAAVVDHVRDLAHRPLEAEIADQFNREGLVSATGKRYTTKMIQWIRSGHHIRPAALE